MDSVECYEYNLFFFMKIHILIRITAILILISFCEMTENYYRILFQIYIYKNGSVMSLFQLCSFFCLILFFNIIFFVGFMLFLFQYDYKFSKIKVKKRSQNLIIPYANK